MDYKELALKAEEEYNFEKALEYYRKCENKLSISDGTLIRYGELLFEFQEFEDAEKIFEKIIKIDNKNEFKEKLARIYEETNKVDKALRIYKELGINEKVKKLESEINLSIPNKQLIRKFMELFSGREDVFSIQFENGYRPIRRPLNFKDIEEHLAGKKTLGIYVLKSDNTIKFAAYDIDIKKSYLNSESRYIYEENSKKVTKKLSEILDSENIKHYVEFTGNRGYHIWFFFEEPIMSYKIKLIMEKILEKIDIDEGIDVEVFPKQTELHGGLGNLIKVPLGVHKKTGKKCLFVDENFEIFNDQISYFLSIETNPKNIMEALFNEFSEEYTIYEKTEKYKPSRTKKKTTNYVKKEIRRHLPKINNSKFDTMIKGCYVLNQLIEKINDKAFINEEEEEILIKSLINIEDGEKFLKQQLMKTINFSQKRFEMLSKQSKGVPITCEEIRKTVLNKNLEIDLEKCSCKFPGNYNSPYAIIENMEELFFDKIDINDIAKKIIEKNAEKFEIEKEIKNLKRMIVRKMGDKSEIRIEIGTIKKSDDDIDIIL